MHAWDTVCLWRCLIILFFLQSTFYLWYEQKEIGGFSPYARVSHVNKIMVVRNRS